MLKKIALCVTFLSSSSLIAATEVDLYQAPLNRLNQFPLTQDASKTTRTLNSSPKNNSLQQMNQTKEDNEIITRYQQMYKGIPVIGAQIMITKTGKQVGISKDNAEVNGHLLEDIQIDIKPTISSQQALELAKKSYFNVNPQADTQQEKTELQIRPGENDELTLVYLVSFKSIQKDGKPSWPFFVIDAKTGAFVSQWNNIKTYLDSGPGGNEKVHEYWYGKDGLPGLEVTQMGNQCVMDNAKVKLVNLYSEWDWDNMINSPFQYTCNNNVEENINGAFSPSNDAYFFGHTIVNMYQDWYGLNALQQPDGRPMKLVMRVHFGTQFDNAFWDGQAMSFGDGEDFYPLVSLDVAGHEVTHGFTEQHSGLEYHDQSGALNESMSDMAGQASRAYLLEQNPLMYNKAYLQPNEITWGIGETVVREAFGKALRFMDYPSSDGSSADCLDKNLAQSKGAYCAISYDELIAFAESNFSDPQYRQNYIVHTASGVFNKAFYLLSKDLGIKKAYHLMVIANMKYWTPATDFISGACGVVYAGRELSVDSGVIQSAFGQVGIDTSNCAV
ncbi:hemagglutinin/protease, zinc metalloprotease [Legionella moravica]|uniref:Neutral metalloproteinase n=1 Tax=Legionella moravica TaxID=39962 RepID=A0A378JQX6_9GAMM|nr:M4 family metallopeptidase [Legionella moravica]KTD34509.1 hemagglutinin/protease, zinc metalloprotease [Legionella moravica]STX61115.1 hemagglutinin/protease, zinc metalloprotease [Legionella moravica]